MRPLSIKVVHGCLILQVCPSGTAFLSSIAHVASVCDFGSACAVTFFSAGPLVCSVHQFLFPYLEVLVQGAYPLAARASRDMMSLPFFCLSTASLIQSEQNILQMSFLKVKYRKNHSDLGYTCTDMKFQTGISFIKEGIFHIVFLILQKVKDIVGLTIMSF